MSLGSQIKKYRQKFGMTLEQLEEASGVQIGTLGALEARNSTKSMYAMDIAKGLGLTLEQLLDETREYERYETTTELDPKPEKPLPPIEKEFLTVPLFKRPDWNSMHNMGTPIAWLTCPYKEASHDTFALTVRDDAMLSLTGYGSFTAGDIVFIDPNLKDDYRDKDFVLATSSHFKMASIKQYIVQDDAGFLYTSNPSWQTQWIPITDETIKIHGVVVAKITVTR